ncbi:MAG: RsmD family RNA methyltransferase [Pyramidobacter sp.]|nr:RsmD family RNA methyltransferase [Pyramidobacter sp.]
MHARQAGRRVPPLSDAVSALCDRGRRAEAAKAVKEVRPTTGKTLGALFSILGPLHGMSFLDLFSGTGRVAAEARKRGASIVTVELVRERASAIRRTLGDTSHIQLCMDVRRALNWCEKRNMSFDVIFADPPYEMKWMSELPGILAVHSGLLKPDGVIVIERSESEPLMLENTPWELVDERRYGISVLDFLKLKETEHVQA